MEMLINLAAYLIVVSVSVERAVVFIKPPAKLVEAFGSRTAWLNQFIAACLGFAFALATPPTLPFAIDPTLAAVLVGLLASGGSGVWHDALSAMTAIKDAKRADAKLSELAEVNKALGG